MVAQIAIPVPDVDTLVSNGFSVIEIEKQDTHTGAYSLITGRVPLGAQIVAAAANTMYRMGGRLIGLSVDGNEEVLISFSSVVDHWTPEQVATRVNEVLPDVASVANGSVVFTSLSIGRSSTIKATYSTATDLALPVGVIHYGIDQNIPLVLDSFIYPYVDLVGELGNKYKWRYSNDVLSPTSALYGPILGGAHATVPTSIGTAFFVGLDGLPKVTSIIVVSDRSPTRVGVVGAANDRPMSYTSDDQGFLQVQLVQGAVVRVAIEGSAYVREITVPNTPTFDLLTAMSTAPDPFTVQSTPPYLIRRSI